MKKLSLILPALLFVFVACEQELVPEVVPFTQAASTENDLAAYEHEEVTLTVVADDFIENHDIQSSKEEMRTDRKIEVSKDKFLAGFFVETESGYHLVSEISLEDAEQYWNSDDGENLEPNSTTLKEELDFKFLGEYEGEEVLANVILVYQEEDMDQSASGQSIYQNQCSGKKNQLSAACLLNACQSGQRTYNDLAILRPCASSEFCTITDPATNTVYWVACGPSAL